MESYLPDGNRVDMRPFLHPSDMTSWPVKKMEKRVELLERNACIGSDGKVVKGN